MTPIVLTNPNVIFVKLDENALLPKVNFGSDAGADLFCSQTTVVKPFTPTAVPTGVRLAIPVGYYGRVASKSGLALKMNLHVTGGVIDSSYRGELKCIMMNFGTEDYTFEVGSKVAQLIIEKIVTPEYVETKHDLDATNRGEGGFGSTGFGNSKS